MLKKIFILLNKLIQVFSLTSKKDLFFILSFSLILIVIETIGIGLIGPVIASVMDENLLLQNKYFIKIFPFASQFNKTSLLLFTLTLFFGAYLIKALLTIIINLKNLKIFFKLGEKYSNKLLKKYFNIEWSFYSKKDSAEIIRNVIGTALKL